MGILIEYGLMFFFFHHNWSIYLTKILLFLLQKGWAFGKYLMYEGIWLHNQVISGLHCVSIWFWQLTWISRSVRTKVFGVFCRFSRLLWLGSYRSFRQAPWSACLLAFYEIHADGDGYPNTRTKSFCSEPWSLILVTILNFC